MSKVHCFKKKAITSLAKNKEFYFACIRDSEGYAGDQIISKSMFDSLNPPCDLEVFLNCSGQRPFIELREVK